MENNTCLLINEKIKISEYIIIRIPTVGEVLNNDQKILRIASSLTASPFQYMVQLDDMGLDYSELTEYQLFLMLFQTYSISDLSKIIEITEDSKIKNCYVGINRENNMRAIYNESNEVVIDEFIYTQLSDYIRRIYMIERVKTRPGNDEAKKYLLEKERRKQNRNKNKKYEPYFEKLVVALVNRKEFKYDYDSVMDLSVYKFFQSYKQIQTNISFENAMHGVYAGTLDTSKLNDKSCLSWIPTK